MAIAETVITDDQRAVVLGTQEGHFADLKAIEIAPGKLTRSLAAFANADGGELYIGLDEDKNTGARTWRGFADQEAANAHLQVFESLFPLGQDFDYTFLRAEPGPGLVLQVQVRKTRDIKTASDGFPYVRRGAQNLPVQSGAPLRELEYVKGLSSFETETVQAPLDSVLQSESLRHFISRVVPQVEALAWLRKQQLVRGELPTVAGVLLYCDEPQAVLPKRCGIKIYRYKTKDAEGSRETLASLPGTVEGCAYSQIRTAVAVTTQTVEDMKKLGVETLESVAYPAEALHEVITNAVLHRDYSIPDDIHIRVFDNRVEVESPGRLPGHITVKNILDERFARNGTIVRLLNKHPNPPNQDVGEGLNTTFAAMRKLGLREPIIEERKNSVRVMIRHERLASPEVAILEHLESNDRITNKVARQIANISADYRVKAIFNRLEERMLIERVPGTRTSNTAYRKGTKFTSWRGDIVKSSGGKKYGLP